MAEKHAEQHKVFCRFFYLSWVHYKQIYRLPDASYLTIACKLAYSGTGASDADLKIGSISKVLCSVARDVMTVMIEDDKVAFSAHNSVRHRLFSAFLFTACEIGGLRHLPVIAVKTLKCPSVVSTGGCSMGLCGSTAEAEGDTLSEMESSHRL
eukprot:3283733-Amphidinium_carterae.2